jgi:hypothetical protein
MQYTTPPTVISAVIRDRMERGIADLLLSAYDAGYCAGAGLDCEQATHPGLADLLTTLAARHQAEVLALRAWTDPLPRDAPIWLRAAAERHVLEQARPDGWPL